MTSKTSLLYVSLWKKQHNRTIFYLPTSCEGSREEFRLTEMAADLSIKRPLERMCQNWWISLKKNTKFISCQDLRMIISHVAAFTMCTSVCGIMFDSNYKYVPRMCVNAVCNRIMTCTRSINVCVCVQWNAIINCMWHFRLHLDGYVYTEDII